jgi:hypothetical protein
MAHRDHFTCYLTEHDGIWEGLCADLDIAVEGRSMEDTRDRLGQAVRSYLADVMDEAPEHRERLLNRRAPWTVRANLAIRAALQGLKGHGREARFVMPCPV